MIGKFESNKDLIQELTATGARHVGNIATIITGTVAEVTREIGEWVTDAIEMREAAVAAQRDAAAQRAAAADSDYDQDFDDEDLEPVVAHDDSSKPTVTAAEPEFIDAEVVDPR
ncbi:hypothetical protein [Nocardia sp. NBC_01327]|uniref:hypothetical protein n=1 Tax=Nocardia sp. NBC_01327 TaxID=2903593 RepID=UPI002E140413|nr:hypothetical protein OG326_09890 [Nocardia sp. NBC_01327]